MTPPDSPFDDQRITPRGHTQFARKLIPDPQNPAKSNTCETSKKPRIQQPQRSSRATNSRSPYDASFIQSHFLGGARVGLNEDARFVLYVMIETGLRLSQIVNLTQNTNMLHAPIPYVRIIADGRRLKTGDSERDIPLTGVALKALKLFANLLPEGTMREYLAERAGVNPKREFFLLWVLGKDLPGALTIHPADGEAWPPEDNRAKDDEDVHDHADALRFSLAGVQLKFSAVKDAAGGLTIPAEGVGGSWIVKLPSTKHDSVPENEFAMMTLAAKIGRNVPELRLIALDAITGLPKELGTMKGPALAIRRFDRTPDGPVHIEDFAQIFRVYPEDKYKKASYRNIAEVIAAEGSQNDIAEFIRRLVFNTLIGNADMHLKNRSLIYTDRRRASLAPAYDFVSTIPYIADENSALTYARTKKMSQFSYDELAYPPIRHDCQASWSSTPHARRSRAFMKSGALKNGICP